MVTKNRPWFKFWPEDIPQHIDYPEVPLFQLLTDTADRYPQNTAFQCQGLGITYRELDTITSKLALALRALGIKKRERVLVLLPNSLQFIISYYAIMKAGAIIVPTNPLYKASELWQQINDSKAKVIITSKKLHPVVKEIESKTGVRNLLLPDDEKIIDTSWVEKLSVGKPLVPVRVEIKPKQDVVTILYTGGTTGEPRGVMLTHYNLVANAIQNAVWFGWSQRDVVIGLLPFYHTWGGCTCISSPVYAGARVIIIPRLNIEELLMTIEKEQATVLYGAASLFTMLVNSPIVNKYDLSSLRYVKAGAMPIPFELKERWEKVTGVKMVLGYGLTEASPETHNSPPFRVKAGTIGIPVIDAEARIVDRETGTVNLPPGEVGELVVKGPQVMKGYWRSPSETKAILRRGWLHTGDLATMDEDGYFRIVDRKKETIKYKGYTIMPAELEDTLYMLPAVKECAVVGLPDPLVGEIPKAFIVLKEGYRLSDEEIIKFCQEKLAPYKKIREVQFIDEIPKTPVGKVLRRVLRDRAIAGEYS